MTDRRPVDSVLQMPATPAACDSVIERLGECPPLHQCDNSNKPLLGQGLQVSGVRDRMATEKCKCLLSENII